MTDPAPQALLDKQGIAELLTRYLRSVDRGDVATLRVCYLPGATEDHGGLLTPDPSVLRMSGKFPADRVYAPRSCPPAIRLSTAGRTPCRRSGAPRWYRSRRCP